MKATFDRYQSFRQNGNILAVPFIEIPQKNSDMWAYYRVGQTRLDLLSYQYYNNPNYGWLILQANPQYGSLEFKIPDGSKLRIPYPLEMTIQQYQMDIDEYMRLYGVENID